MFQINFTKRKNDKNEIFHRIKADLSSACFLNMSHARKNFQEHKF